MKTTIVSHMYMYMYIHIRYVKLLQAIHVYTVCVICPVPPTHRTVIVFGTEDAVCASGLVLVVSIPTILAIQVIAVGRPIGAWRRGRNVQQSRLVYNYV